MTKAGGFLVLMTSMLLSCASQPPQIQQQLITPAMVFAPSEPILTLSPDKATQRDVAFLIISLREWGRQMVLQLNSVSKLLEQSK